MAAGRIGAGGIDVYEEESAFVFEDHSERFMPSGVLAELLTFSNVMVTSHQAWLTREALHNIARTTLANIAAFQSGKRGNDLVNLLRLPLRARAERPTAADEPGSVQLFR